jgi:hypothetical protein
MCGLNQILTYDFRLKNGLDEMSRVRGLSDNSLEKVATENSVTKYKAYRLMKHLGYRPFRLVVKAKLTPDMIRNRLTFSKKIKEGFDSERPWLYRGRPIFFGDETHIRLSPKSAGGKLRWSYRPSAPIEERENTAKHVTVSGMYAYGQVTLLWIFFKNESYF